MSEFDKLFLFGMHITGDLLQRMDGPILSEESVVEAHIDGAGHDRSVGHHAAVVTATAGW